MKMSDHGEYEEEEPGPLAQPVPEDDVPPTHLNEHLQDAARNAVAEVARALTCFRIKEASKMQYKQFVSLLEITFWQILLYGGFPYYI